MPTFNNHHFCAFCASGAKRAMSDKLKGITKNPEGPDEDEADEADIHGKKYKCRVLRGGSWSGCSSTSCSSVARHRTNPVDWNSHYGFRIVGAVPAR